MPKYIDADELYKQIEKEYDEHYDGLDIHGDVVQGVNIAYHCITDMSESIVRCKDCKFFEPVSEYSGNCYRNEINNIFDGYCNKAERRESE